MKFNVMKRSVIVLGCALLAGPAFAQSAGETTGVNSLLGISPSTADFVKEVAISDLFEIEAGNRGLVAGLKAYYGPRYRRVVRPAYAFYGGPRFHRWGHRRHW
jgi:hypothetical protein